MDPFGSCYLVWFRGSGFSLAAMIHEFTRNTTNQNDPRIHTHEASVCFLLLVSSHPSHLQSPLGLFPHVLILIIQSSTQRFNSAIVAFHTQCPRSLRPDIRTAVA